MSELKRCPFCGGEARLFKTHENQHGIIHENDGCPISTEHFVGDWVYDTAEEAIKAWNTRKPMQNIVERLEHFNEETFYRANGRANGKTLAYGYSQGIYKAIEIVKEEGGMNET